MGFGGTVPCAQTKGIEGQTFYFEGQHPEELLRNGNYDHMPILMGATTHEGSFVYGGRFNLHLLLEPIHKTFQIFNLGSLLQFGFYFTVVYNEFIVPNNISQDENFLKYEFTDFLLRALGIEQEYAFSDSLTEKYWHKDQIGNLTAMAPGAVDVSLI